VLRERARYQPLHIVGLATGDDASVNLIAAGATGVLKLGADVERRLEDSFDWVSQSVSLAAAPVTSYGAQTLELPEMRTTRRLMRGSLGRP
jgi:hypothetical protein